MAFHWLGNPDLTTGIGELHLDMWSCRERNNCGAQNFYKYNRAGEAEFHTDTECPAYEIFFLSSVTFPISSVTFPSFPNLPGVLHASWDHEGGGVSGRRRPERRTTAVFRRPVGALMVALTGFFHLENDSSPALFLIRWHSIGLEIRI